MGPNRVEGQENWQNANEPHSLRLFDSGKEYNDWCGKPVAQINKSYKNMQAQDKPGFH